MKSPFGILDHLDESRNRTYHTQENVQSNREKMRQTVMHKDLFSLLQSHQKQHTIVEEEEPKVLKLPKNPMLRKHQKKRPKSAGVIPIKVMQEVLADNPKLFDHPLMLNHTQQPVQAANATRTSALDSLYQNAGTKIAFSFLKKGSNPHSDEQFAEKARQARSEVQKHIQKRQEVASKETSSFSSEMFEEVHNHYRQLLLTIQEANDICRLLCGQPHFSLPLTAACADLSLEDHLLVYEPCILHSRSLAISSEEVHRLFSKNIGGKQVAPTTFYSPPLMHILSCIFLYPQRILRVKSYIKRKSRRERRPDGVTDGGDASPVPLADESPSSALTSSVRILTWPNFLAEHSALQHQYCSHNRVDSVPASLGGVGVSARPKTAGSVRGEHISKVAPHRTPPTSGVGQLTMERVIQNVVQAVTTNTTSSSGNNYTSSGAGSSKHKSVSFIQPVMSAVREDDDYGDFVPPAAPNPQAYFDQVGRVQQVLQEILADLAKRGEDINMQVAHIVRDKGWNKYAHLH